MALKIVKAADAVIVDRVNLCIYGAPGIRKTTLAFTADQPLLLDADEGAHRAYGRKDSVPVKKWDDMAGIVAADLAPYSTLIVDTAGRALDKLTLDIIAKDPKKGYGGSLTLPGWGDLKGKFSSWMRMVNGFGKDVVLICHMDEQHKGDSVIERLDVQGGSKNEIYKSVDAMGKLYIEGKQWKLDFSPRENAYGKNPGQFDVLTVPNPIPTDFLGGLIRQIKERLNQFSVEQLAEEKRLAEWREAIAGCKTPADFTQFVPQIKKDDTVVKMMLYTAAVNAGFTFDTKANAFQGPKTAVKAEPIPPAQDDMSFVSMAEGA